jgi:hypothetical protein
MSTVERLSLRELARRLDRDPSGLGRLARKGVIPKGDDGKFDEAAVRMAIADHVDPARQKEEQASLRSTPKRSTVHTCPATGTFPTPEAYRDRFDIADPFLRGALYGAHAVAHGIPVAAGCTAQEVGVTGAGAVQAYGLGREEAVLLVAGVCADLGLIPEGSDDAGPHIPTAFGGFDTSAIGGLIR